MCGFCPGATAGEASSFYKSVRDGTATHLMLQKMEDHSTRMSLPARQEVELLEDPDLFAGKPEFREELLALVDSYKHGWISQLPTELQRVNQFEKTLVDLREKFDEVIDHHDLVEMLEQLPVIPTQTIENARVHIDT